jgi:threonine aldolase
MIIDLRSDTVTRPTAAMKAAMMNAEVGDDVFSEDPSINALENKMATLFGQQAGLFCPSGTMTNQIAVKTHTQPMDEVIIEKSNHIYYYEAGGIAFNSAASIRLIDGDRGRIKPHQIESNINPDSIHNAKTSLVCIENTSNRGGGAYYTLQELQDISTTTHQHKLKLHLDGARLFNAIVELNYTTQQIGSLFDSVSICLSKGLACPVGSVLVGDNDFIHRARKYRKVFGGGMRQAGFIAAAGIYALDNHILRLKEDHTRAKKIEEVLLTLPFIETVLPVMTNIIIFKLKPTHSAEQIVEHLKSKNILSFAIGYNQIRFVTHLDFDDEMLAKAIDVIKELK